MFKCRVCVKSMMFVLVCVFVLLLCFVCRVCERVCACFVCLVYVFVLNVGVSWPSGLLRFVCVFLCVYILFVIKQYMFVVVFCPLLCDVCMSLI